MRPALALQLNPVSKEKTVSEEEEEEEKRKIMGGREGNR